MRAISTTSQASPWSLPIDFTITAVTDGAFTAPVDLLLTQLTLLDDAGLSKSKSPTLAAAASQDVHVVSKEAALLHLAAGNDQSAQADTATQGEPRLSRSIASASMITIDESDVDALMANMTAMHQLLEI